MITLFNPSTNHIAVKLGAAPGRITEDDLKQMYDFFEGGYFDINGRIMHSSVDDYSNKVIDTIDELLLNVKTYSGDLQKDITTKDSVTENIMHEFSVGNIVTFEPYLRCYVAGPILDKESNITLYISGSKKAHDFRKLWRGEGEILYDRQSQFKVKKVKSDKSRIHVYMQEV